MPKKFVTPHFQRSLLRLMALGYLHTEAEVIEFATTHHHNWDDCPFTKAPRATAPSKQREMLRQLAKGKEPKSDDELIPDPEPPSDSNYNPKKRKRKESSDSEATPSPKTRTNKHKKQKTAPTANQEDSVLFGDIPAEIRFKVWSYAAPPFGGIPEEYEGVVLSCKSLKEEFEAESLRNFRRLFSKVRKDFVEEFGVPFRSIDDNPKELAHLKSIDISLPCSIFRHPDHIIGFPHSLAPLLELNLRVYFHFYEDQIGARRLTQQDIERFCYSLS